MSARRSRGGHTGSQSADIQRHLNKQTSAGSTGSGECREVTGRSQSAGRLRGVTQGHRLQGGKSGKERFQDGLSEHQRDIQVLFLIISTVESLINFGGGAGRGGRAERWA